MGDSLASRQPGISPPPLKRRKTAVGDDGDRVQHVDASNAWENESLRIFSWNINGIAAFLQPSITSFFEAGAGNSHSPRASLRSFLRRHSWPDILGLQEVKINAKDEATKKAVKTAVNRDAGVSSDGGPQYDVHFCLPQDPHNARGFGGKVYGVATIARRDFAAKYNVSVRTVNWDKEGRVLILETQAPTKLSLWNIYAVNGTANDYRDPETGEVAGTRHDRKLAFHDHLLNECKQLESDGFAVLLSGDLNVARDLIDGYPNLRTFPEQHILNRRDFNSKFFDSDQGLRAADAFRVLHPLERKYTYHPRNIAWKTSCDRVDLFILSRQLVDDRKCLIAAGVLESPQERGPSDHCPHFVELDTNRLGL